MNNKENVKKSDHLNEDQKNLLLKKFDLDALIACARLDKETGIIFNGDDTEAWLVCEDPDLDLAEKAKVIDTTHNTSYDSFTRHFFSCHNDNVDTVANYLGLSRREVINRLVDMDNSFHNYWVMLFSNFTLVKVRNLFPNALMEQITYEDIPDGKINLSSEDLKILNSTFTLDELVYTRKEDDRSVLIFNEDSTKVYLITRIKWYDSSGVRFRNPDSVMFNHRDFIKKQLLKHDYNIKELIEKSGLSPDSYLAKLLDLTSPMTLMSDAIKYYDQLFGFHMVELTEEVY